MNDKVKIGILAGGSAVLFAFLFFFLFLLISYIGNNQRPTETTNQQQQEIQRLEDKLTETTNQQQQEIQRLEDKLTETTNQQQQEIQRLEDKLTETTNQQQQQETQQLEKILIKSTNQQQQEIQPTRTLKEVEIDEDRRREIIKQHFQKHPPLEGNGLERFGQCLGIGENLSKTLYPDGLHHQAYVTSLYLIYSGLVISQACDVEIDNFDFRDLENYDLVACEEDITGHFSPYVEFEIFPFYYYINALYGCAGEDFEVEFERVYQKSLENNEELAERFESTLFGSY